MILDYLGESSVITRILIRGRQQYQSQRKWHSEIRGLSVCEREKEGESQMYCGDGLAD